MCKLERHDPVLFKKEKELMETISSICYQWNAHGLKPAWPQFYFLNIHRLSSGCAFFPQVCRSSILQADLSSVSPHMLIGSRRSVAKHRRRCCCRTSEICGDHLAQVAIKAKEPGRFSPPANQRACSSSVPKLMRWWRSDSFASQIQIDVVHQHVNTVLPT